MGCIKVLLLAVLCMATSAKKESYKVRARNRERTMSSSEEQQYYSNNGSDLFPSSYDRPKGDVIVERFVETLMASERYLKMIELIDRKLSTLDTTLQERSNIIHKYLTEILRTLKVAPTRILEESLRALKGDLDKLKEAVGDKQEPPQMRGKIYQGEGIECHSEGLESRLTVLDNNMKNVVAGVDSILSTISEVKNRQYSRAYTRNDNQGSGAADAMSLINEFRRSLQEQKIRKCDCKGGRYDRSERYPTDCHEIQMQGFNVSGIYKIKPDDLEPFYVLCDLTTAGGGWTVFQNRFDGSQDFYKSWIEYKHGFGNLAGEFWLGLEKLNYLTNQKLYELRIEMETQHGLEAFAGYSVFTVGPEHEGYRISTLGTYYGTAGDSLTYHAGQKFSTFDMDNDEWKEGSCASEHGGAWWYKECDKSNLNGRYLIPTEDNQGQSIYWISFKGPNSPLVKTKMMIRPLPASKPINYHNTQNRKMIENTKNSGKVQKALRSENKPSFAVDHAPYRYREPPRAEIFYHNYAV